MLVIKVLSANDVLRWGGWRMGGGGVVMVVMCGAKRERGGGGEGRTEWWGWVGGRTRQKTVHFRRPPAPGKGRTLYSIISNIHI